MIKHLVFWKLKPEAHGKTAAENAQVIITLLQELNGKVPGLIRLEVGLDFSRTPASADLALASEFTDRAALAAYLSHPLHLVAKEYLALAISERWMVDYEV